MEESQEERKGYLIVRQGPYWKVRNCNRYVGGTFTMLSKARDWVDARAVEDLDKAWKKAIRRLKKIKDLNKRTKEYKKLCQEMGRYS